MASGHTGPYRAHEAMQREPFPRRYKYFKHAADQTLGMRDTGSCHTNRTATGTVTLSLQDSMPSGLFYDFAVEAGQELRVDPGDNSAFVINGAKQTDGKYISSSSINDSFRAMRNDNGDWVVLFETGTWTVEA